MKPNQIRIALSENATAIVDENCPQYVIDSLKRLVEAASKKINCDYCKGTGYDSYPNHSTSVRICPKCGE